MYIVINGFYSKRKPDQVSCGIVTINHGGFYKENFYQEKHLWANNRIAQWFAFEKALDHIEDNARDDVVIFTNFKEIIKTMEKSNEFQERVLNNRTRQSISMFDLYITYLIDRLNKIKNTLFNNIKKWINVSIRLITDYRSDHEKAIIEQCINKAKYLSMFQNRKKVKVKIKKETMNDGIKWVLYENGYRRFVGKRREVVTKYQKENERIKDKVEKVIIMDKDTEKIFKDVAIEA